MEREPDIIRRTHVVMPDDKTIYEAAKAAAKGITWGIIETVVQVVIIIFITNWLFEKLFGW